MPKISQKKRDKISEQILAFLFNESPDSKFTSTIAEELARDEEFTLSLLKELEKNKLLVRITKNLNGSKYLRRQRWRLSNTAYQAYKKHQ